MGFTGLAKIGAHLYSLAARDVRVTRTGASPNIFNDADLDNAVRRWRYFGAVGQTCIAGSRLLAAPDPRPFVEKLVAFTRTARIGDPANIATQIGPIANQMQFDKVLGYIDIARQEGAELALGGGRPAGDECSRGFFVEPTIFTGVNNDMRIAREEVFGPVLSTITFDTEEEALAIANDSEYLAAMWTADMKAAP